MKIRKITFFLCVLMLIFGGLSSYGQKKDKKPKKNPPNPHKPPPPHPELPIDGGISYLLIAGITFGVYQIKRKKIST